MLESSKVFMFGGAVHEEEVSQIRAGRTVGWRISIVGVGVALVASLHRPNLLDACQNIRFRLRFAAKADVQSTAFRAFTVGFNVLGRSPTTF